MLTEAIILAGGLGTRLRSEVQDLPKAMAPINDQPFLAYQLAYLAAQGIQKVYLAVGYKSEAIVDYFGHQYQSMALEYVVEETPLGTGGAVVQALAATQTNHVLIGNGDTMFEVDLKAMAAFHETNQANLTMALKYLEQFSRYGTVHKNEKNRIEGFEEKTYKEQGLINGGLYLLDKQCLEAYNFPEKFSLEKLFLEQEYPNLAFYGFESTGYFLDIGIPEDYKRAQEDFKQFSV